MRSRNKLLSVGVGLCLATTAFSQGHSGHGHSAPAVSPSSSPSDPHAGHGTSHSPASSGKLFQTSVAGLPEVVPSTEVKLPDGADYLIEAKAAKQKIGNQWIRRLAYNGSVPGPIIRVEQGSTLNVTLRNSTDVETTLHPHGLRVDYRSDGVPGIGQAPIKIGDSFEYNLSFPDAGIYWYHPHVREDYSQEAGLYGVFIVEPKEKSTYNAVHREIPLVLDDVLIDPKKPFSTDKVTHTLMGRYGNVNLINGTVNPTMEFVNGEIVRFFLLNTSNTRVFAFAIPNTKLKVVGGDNGLFEKEAWSDKIILGPGERSIVEVQFSKPGNFPILNNKPKKPVAIGQVAVRAGSVQSLGYDFSQLRTNPSAIADLSSVRRQLSKPLDKTLQLTLDMDHNALPMNMGGMDHSGMNHSGMDHSGMNHSGSAGKVDPFVDGIEWDDDMPEMNSASDTSNVVWKMVDVETKKSNMDIDWTFNRGQYVKIRLFNDPNSMHPMQHPIHFHGQRFIIAAMNGERSQNLVWKDTALIPSGSTVDIILENSNPGQWMSHCHISEHMEAQMMFKFNVLN